MINVFPLSGTTPAAASTAVVATLPGLSRYTWFILDTKVLGATGGTLDLGIQRKIEGQDLWVPWLRFAQLAGSASAIYQTYESQSGAGIITVFGWDTTASPTSPASWTLAAGAPVAGHPGDQIRLVATAGSGTSAGAAIVIWVTCIQSPL